METSQKGKLLVLLKIFETMTDEEHPLTAPELVDELKKRGVSVERKKVFRDIEALGDFGYDIVLQRGKKAGYFLASRSFEVAEVRLLTDAVQSAWFITPKKTKQLLKKLEVLLSKHQAKSISRQVYVDSRLKCNNEQIYYTIDILNKAVAEGLKVTFAYRKNEFRSPSAGKKEDRAFVVSPYALLWSNDKYYLVGNYEKYDNLSHFRIDRIFKAEITDRESRDFEEVCEYTGKFDVADYAKRNFNMFGGVPGSIELKCKNEIYEIITDRFGDDISVHQFGDGHFIVRDNVHISDGLVRWLVEFGDVIEVISPASLRLNVVERINKISNNYAI